MVKLMYNLEPTLIISSIVTLAIALSTALGAVKFDHYLRKKNLKENLIKSLLTEIQANYEHLKKAKYAILYDDAYSFAKNSGNLKLLPFDIQKKLSILYVAIKNRNDWIYRWSFTMGTIDWESYLIRTEDGDVSFPKWVEITQKRLLNSLERVTKILENQHQLIVSDPTIKFKM